MGDMNKLYNVNAVDGQLHFWRIDKDMNFDDFTVDMGSSSRVVNSILDISHLADVCDKVSNTVSGGNGIYQLSQGNWKGFFETLINSGIDFAVGKELANHPAVLLSYIYGKGSLEYYQWNEARRQVPALYADCQAEIVNATGDSEGDDLVFVKVTNIRSLGDFLYNFYDKTPSEMNRNRVYCGVVARRVFTPTYHNHASCSEMVCLNEEDYYGNETELMYTMKLNDKHRYILRPFLVSSRIMDDKNDIREEYIKYGERYVYDPTGEYAILKKFFNSTNGREWCYSTNWLTDEPLSKWYGITLDDEGRVKSINLKDNNVTGVADLGLLENLKELNLDNNPLEGMLLDLPNFSSIEFSNCMLRYGDIKINGCQTVILKDLKEVGRLNILTENLIVDNCQFGDTSLPFSSVHATSVVIKNSTMYNCGLNNDYLEFINSKTTNTWHCNTNKRAKLINSTCSVICSWDFSSQATINVSNTHLIQPEWNKEKTGTYSFTTNSKGWAQKFSE